MPNGPQTSYEDWLQKIREGRVANIPLPSDAEKPQPTYYDTESDLMQWRRSVQRLGLANQYDIPKEEPREDYTTEFARSIAFDKNIDTSVWKTIRDQHPEKAKEIYANVEKKKRRENMVRQTVARLASAVPVFGPNLAEKVFDLSEVDFTPVELEALRDSSTPVYDSTMEGIPIGFGQSINLRDASELTVGLARFIGIGSGTTYALQKLPMFKGGKYMSLMTNTNGWKRAGARAAKAAVDFNIDAYSHLYPELTKEGIPLEEKIHSMVMTFPKATISGSLFGALGGAKGVIKQYGGVFAAGYGSALVEGADHREAFKSGTLLSAMHFTNALGTRAGKLAFKNWGKKNHMSDEDVSRYADMVVEERYDKTKPFWRVQDPAKYGLEADGNGRGRVQVVKETGKGNKRFVVLEDQNSPKKKKTKVSAGAFYKNFTRRRNPQDSETIRTNRLGKIHQRMKRMKISNTEKEQQLKREEMGAREEPMQERKEGEIPYYEYLSRRTKEELFEIGKRYGIDPAEMRKMNRAEMAKNINKKIPRQPGRRLSLAEATPEQLYNIHERLRKQETKINVEQDIRQGVYRPNETGTKVHIVPENIMFSVQDTIRSKMRGDQLALVDSFHESERFRKKVKELKITPDRYRDIIRAAAGEKGVAESLSAKETQILDMWKESFETGRIFAEQSGVIDNAIDHYWPGLFKGEPKEIRKAINKYIDANPESQFAKEKKFKTPTEAEAFAKEANLEVIYDIPYLVDTWWGSIGKAASAKRFVQRIKDLPNNTTGERLISESYVEGYARMDDPHFARTVTGKKRGGTVWVDPRVAGELEHIITPAESPRKAVRVGSRWFKKWSGNIKRVIMYNPLIHGWNIYSDAFDELWFSSWSNAFPLIKTARLTGLFPGIKYSPKKQLKMYEKMGFDGTLEDLQRAMAKGGVNQEITGRRGSEIDEYMRENMPDLTANPMVNLGKHPVKTVKQLADKALWGRIVQSAQETVFALKYSEMMAKGHTPDRAGVMAGHYTNDLLGTTGAEVFVPKDGAFLNGLFFARNWTISNLRLVSGAVGLQSEHALFLGHKGLSKVEMKALQGEYIKHLVKGVMGLALFTNGLNALATGTSSFQHAYDPDKARWAMENPEGHRLDVDLGMKDNKGRQIYIVMPLFRYMRDYFGWFGEPMQTFWNKISPIGKQLLEQGLNYSFWSRRPIAPRAAGLKDRPLTIANWQKYSKSAKRLRYLAEGFTPLAQMPFKVSERPGEVRNWYEKYTPLLGTWIRHGAAGGRPGELINEYLSDIKFERDEIDVVLDEMIQEGDISGAITEMVQSKRYKTLDAIRDRLLRYRDPLHYKWTVMLSRERRAEFLKWLRKNHPKDATRVRAEIGKAPEDRHW